MLGVALLMVVLPSTVWLGRIAVVNLEQAILNRRSQHDCENESNGILLNKSQFDASRRA